MPHMPHGKLLLLTTIVNFSLYGCGPYHLPDKNVATIRFEPDTVFHISANASAKESCTVDSIRWSPGNAESILLSPLKDVFPGAVLDAESFQTGKYILIDDDKRLPVTMFVNGPIFSHSAIAKDVVPKPGFINDAITNILKDSVVGIQPAQMVIDVEEVFSDEHLKLMFKGSYSGGVTSIEGGFDFNDQSVKSRYIVNMTQVYYTVDINNPSRRGFFSSQPEGITDYSPVFVSQVKYGRRVMIAIESKSNIQSRSAQLKAEFGMIAKTKLETSLINEEFVRNNSFKMLVMGGNPDTAFKVMRSVGDLALLSNALASDAKWSLKALAVPLAYTVNYASNGAVFNVATTGTYVARKCLMKPIGEFVLPSSTITNICPVPMGDDREFAGNPFFNSTVKITNEGNNIYAIINADWQENDGDTHGAITNYKALLGSVPDSLEVLDITSYKECNVPAGTMINGYGPYKLPLNTNESNSCVQAYVAIGDSDNDDDMYPNECVDDIHTKIKSITFYPVRVSCTRRGVLKQNAKDK